MPQKYTFFGLAPPAPPTTLLVVFSNQWVTNSLILRCQSQEAEIDREVYEEKLAVYRKLLKL
jgi:hypothetical protein